jgi:hypothetical protein
MSSFKSISRPSLNNKGGLTRLLLADVDDVLNDRIRVVRGTGYVNEPIVLKDGVQWLEIEFTPKSLKLEESTKKQFGSSLFPMSLSWRQAKDEAWKLDQLQRMERKRWLALVQSANQEWMLIGTPDEPAVFKWTDRKPGTMGTDYNGYSLELVLSRRAPVPFYKVHAIFYWNSSGQLVFDNTFDPSLTAEMDPLTGDLTISGPNSNLYEEINGILYYTG